MSNRKFEDIIAEQSRLIYTAEGDSMFPLIRPRDLLVIEAVKSPLKVNDVPLYKRDSGQYVLHRIVEISRSGYVMKGDNRTVREKGIRDRHIIGVLTAVIRDGKTLHVESPDEYNARIADDLIYLLSCIANDVKPDPQKVGDMELTEIYYMSRKHYLTSAAAFALEGVMPLPHTFDQAMKKAIRKLTLFEVERAAVCAEFDKESIWYLPLKGILLKECYPKTAMREMSDNDLLVDPTRMDDIRRIMERLGYKCEVFGVTNYDAYSKPPTIEFEMHRSLFGKWEMPLFASYYEDIKDRLLQDGCSCRMTDEDFYLYVICHTYKHYIHAGSGLRSLLDLYFFLKPHLDMNTDYLKAELQKLGLTEFEEQIRTLAQKTFSFTELDSAEREALSQYISAGSYGNKNNAEYNHLAKSLGNDDSKEAKKNYLKRRLFISGDDLADWYPFVAKHKAVYPLFLTYRTIKGVILRPGAIVREYKSVKKFRKKDN